MSLASTSVGSALRACALRTSPFTRGASPQSGTSSQSQTTMAAPPATGAAGMSFPHQRTAGGMDRRDILMVSSSLVLSHMALLIAGPPPAKAAGLDRYVRKKQLEPLETYVPVVLEARAAVARVAELAVQDATTARTYLRQGPFNGLRDNIRALGEYAVRDARTSEAGTIVAAFFRALEGLDSLLYTAIRDKTDVDKQEVDARAAELEGAFDKLLATVPEEVLQQARRVLDVANRKAAEAAGAGAGSSAAEQPDEELLMLLR